ncbi:efflux RND transporter periplasmic adaptor subunit [Agaribacter flavus]|uniref:Efflux RND transporter periplasmic adaptor subunit n=1 Tax=Agaribacter flavus TaxID=1902781 RepID=A0ABV7FPU6_9ALTE
MRKVGIPILILVVAVVVTVVLIATKPEPEKKEVKPPEFLVESQAIELENVEFLVYAQGSVQPKHRTMLSAQVSGRVVSLSDNFVEGGFFNKGDVLVTLESDDYETDLRLQEAELARAQAALDEEIARANVAKQEWQSVNSGTPPALGLRKPQLAREEANLKAAKANLQRAKRNLERTKIRAPYDGLVKSRSIDLGQFLPLGGQVGELYSTEVAEVRLPLTDDDVAFVGNIKQQQPNVSMQASVAGKQVFWQGRLVRDEAVLDENRRVSYGVVEIQDPYNLKGNVHPSPLRFGRFVSAVISGVDAENVIKLPRHVLRLDGTVLSVDQDNKLRINDVEVTRTDETNVYISKGLDTSHEIVLSAVSSAYDGMPVRKVAPPKVLSPGHENIDEGEL